MLEKNKYRYHLVALAVMMIWGTTYISSKVLMTNGLSPAEVFFLRFVLAYACIWIVAPRRLWADSLRDELLMAGAGLCGGSLYFLTEYIALQYSPAANVSLIVCTAPLWTSVVLSLLYRDERMNRHQMIGAAAAFGGMVLVVLNGHFVLQLSPKGDLLAFGSALSWTLYSLIMKKVGSHYPALFITRKVFIYGLITILPALLTGPHSFDLQILSRPVVWMNLLFLGVVASMICYVMWAKALRELGVVRATNYAYVNPMVTMITAAICINEPITTGAVFGAAMILLGMWYAERSKGIQPK